MKLWIEKHIVLCLLSNSALNIICFVWNVELWGKHHNSFNSVVAIANMLMAVVTATLGFLNMDTK